MPRNGGISVDGVTGGGTSITAKEVPWRAGCCAELRGEGLRCESSQRRLCLPRLKELPIRPRARIAVPNSQNLDTGDHHVEHGTKQRPASSHAPTQRQVRVCSTPRDFLVLHTLDRLCTQEHTIPTVYVFERQGSGEKFSFPYSLGEPYLLGFGSVRSQDGWSDSFFQPKRQWVDDIYEHPCRLTAEAPFPRYLNTYDIYGLGVVLLELGLWRPIGRFENRLAALVPEERRRNLVEIAVDLDITMGPKYRSVVQWCLQLDGGEILGDTIFISMVLNKLDELEDVVSL